MKITINSLGVNGGGGKTYLEHFLPALLEADRALEYYVLLKADALPLGLPASPRLRYIPVKFSSSLAGRFWLEQTWLPRWLKKEKIGLLFSPADATSLLAPCPVVLAMRNMNLYIKREKGWSLPFQAKFSALSALAGWSSKIAKKIIFVSRTSQSVISERLHIEPHKQNLIYHGVSPIFLERASTIPEKLLWIKPKTPYLLSVSSIYRYKNFSRLIEAFDLLRKNGSKDYHLIIAGKPYDKPCFREIKEIITAKRLESRVHLAGEIPYENLPALYQHASLFVFPSYLETFGHPLAEAMASGIPIAAANIENSQEIAGKAALYFNPYDIHDIADILGNTLEQPKTREILIAHAAEEVKRFSWNRCARETVAVFKDAMKS